MPIRKLKVFQAQFGFYDTVVAVPSQAAALRAWGIHQNLFASGDAGAATDSAAIDAATEHPGIPLRRPVGSVDPYQLEPNNLPTLPALSKPGFEKRAKPKPPLRKIDRSALTAAERALEQLEVDRKREEATLKAETEALEKHRSAAKEQYSIAQELASTKLVAARKKYEKDGGKDQ